MALALAKPGSIGLTASDQGGRTRRHAAVVAAIVPSLPYLSTPRGASYPRAP